MSKIKVDAIMGFNYNVFNKGEMYGKYRVYYNTAKNLQDRVNFKEIGYIPPKYNIPLKDFMHNFFFYPRMVKNSIRNDTNLVHVFSQEEAYLLKFVKKDTPKILTCLDLIQLIFEPEITPLSTSLLRTFRILKEDRIRFQNHFNNADQIIAISEYTRQDIIKYLKISPEKIKTIHLGVDPKFRIPAKEEKELIKQKYSLPESFILYLGSEQPRKNFPFLLNAFYKLKKEFNMTNIKLVKAGKHQVEQFQHDEIIELIKKLNLEKDVIFIDHVPDEELRALYNLADVFVFPSLYEGFGLPPLEAMACGCPVITSNTSSLPEVVGDAGIMVDPHDINNLSKMMYNVLTDEKLSQKLCKKGLKRSKQFNWEKTAFETLEIYNKFI